MSFLVTVAHLLLRRGAEHGQRQQRFRGCESALLAMHWGEWSGVMAVRECGEMARLGWPFMGELGLVVDAVQGWGWGVGELAIGAELVQVRRSAVANGERVRWCSSLTPGRGGVARRALAVVWRGCTQGVGCAAVLGSPRAGAEGRGGVSSRAWRRVAASSASSTERSRTAAREIGRAHV